MKKEDTRADKRVMKLNRWLSGKYAILMICLAEDVFIFLAAQYIVNLVLNIPLWIKDLDHAGAYIGIRNFLPVQERIAAMPKLHVILYLGILVIGLIFNGITIYQIKTSLSEMNFNTGQKGVARWTTNTEIKQQYKEIPDRDKPFAGAGGTIVSRIGTNLYIDQSPTNNLIIGITRSGKGEMFVFPSIDVYSRAAVKTSMVVCDPKLELYKSSKKTLEARGYKVYLLNLDDPLHSMGFNPLEQIKDEYLKKNYAEAELLAQ